MNWLTPGTALIAAGAAVPALVILYFLKLRRRDVEISTTLLWKKSIEDLQANAPFQKLRRNILLLLQLLALLACLVAVAQPESRADRAPPARVVIVIDRSLSMGAVDEKDEDGRAVSRLEKAKQGAIAQVEALADADLFSGARAGEAMVIAFDAQATVAHPFSADKGSLRSAIEAIEPSDAATDFRPVMRVAGQHIGIRRVDTNSGDNGRLDSVYLPGEPVELWSDGAISGLDSAALHAEATFNYNRVGSEGAVNFAITAMRAGRAFDEPGQASVFIGVQGTAREAKSVDVELLIDDALAGVRAVSLPAADERTGTAQSGVVFRLDRSSGALVTARLVVDDVLKADNQAIVVLPPAKRLSVLLVSAGNFPLRSALEAMPLNELRVMSPSEYQAAAPKGETARFDVIVLDRVLPYGAEGAAPGGVPAGAADASPAPGAEADVAAAESADDGPDARPTEPSIAPGNYLIFGAIPPMRGVRASAAIKSEQGAVILDWRRDHPVLRAITLDPLVIFEQIGVEVTDEARVLARSTEGPVIIEAGSGAARALIVAFDVLESSWPLDLNFVLLVASAVRDLAGQTDADQGNVLRPGETLSTILPNQVAEAELATPDQGRKTLRAGPDGRVSFAPIDRAGLYSLTWTGNPGPSDFVEGSRVTRHMPVSVLDPEESRVRSLESVDLPRGAVKAGNREDSREVQRWWPWLILAMIVLMLVEWYIYNRKAYL